ncbi:glycoside hydrolase family 36 protein [Marinimicrobium sp. ARAG 43.8]|uniref:glycoside hydrolase family 36 protein n=1 Tax=Marinimicrobium sp. ARAG 43.8 TaxID=3418719 RepID=UPI003CF3DAA2
MARIPKISLPGLTAGFLFIALLGCQVMSKNGTRALTDELTLNNGDLLLRFDQSLHSQILTTRAGQTVPLQKQYENTEYIVLNSGIVDNFEAESYRVAPVNDDLGSGEQYTLTGRTAEGMEKQVIVRLYDNHPDTALMSVQYTNQTEAPVRILKWVNNQYRLSPTSASDPAFWSFQGASFADRRDWVQPVTPGYEQRNFMGMNSSDYGSGTPVSDVWTPEAGVGVGHVELTPKLVSLPISYPQGDDAASLGVEYDRPTTLEPGESLTTFETFVTVHQGDYYDALVSYKDIMADKGLEAPEYPDESYEPIWCAWGYERGFTVEEVLQTLPKAKEMGLTWAVLDDGWQTSEGDWYLDRNKFPEGDKSMRELVEDIEEAGLKAKLWWAPLAVDPGTDLINEHEDMLLLDKEGNPVDVTWWDAYYLCPAYAKTKEQTKELVQKMIGDWGYAGLKIDGQHLNGVPPCYNPAHNHDHPEESVEQLQEYWKLVYETAIEINSKAVVEICPCGTSYAFHNMPYMNQSVSSDPLSSWQIRHKGKTLKALMGASSPYYGDHVELSDNASDFASSVGIGAVVGTKFNWPADGSNEESFLLTPEKEREFQHWIDIYKEKMLPKGVYEGSLYDIGFDAPETHAISKDDRMYYAFYADSWQGTVELRGLNRGHYQVMDYENNRSLGTVTSTEDGGSATLDIDVNDHLLLEVIPVD